MTEEEKEQVRKALDWQEDLVEGPPKRICEVCLKNEATGEIVQTFNVKTVEPVKFVPRPAIPICEDCKGRFI